MFGFLDGGSKTHVPGGPDDLVLAMPGERPVAPPTENLPFGCVVHFVKVDQVELPLVDE